MGQGFLKLATTQVPAVTPEQVQAVPRNAFTALGNPQLQAMTRLQVAALNLDQVTGITATRILHLTDDQVGWLLPRMSATDVDALAAPPDSGRNTFAAPLTAALPKRVRPTGVAAGGGVAGRRAALLALLPDKRTKEQSGANLAANTGNPWKNQGLTELIALIAGTGPEYVVPGPNGALGSVSQFYSIAPLELAKHIVTVLNRTASDRLTRWIRRDEDWNNNGRWLPGPQGPPAPYKEFDIYPKKVTGTTRGTHRVVIGIDPANLNRCFYTPDHYRTFFEI